MVLCAGKQGIKATARAFGCSRNTVRKWYRRWRDHGYAGLENLSRRPQRSPNATPAAERVELVRHKKKYKRLGADAVRVLEGLSRSSRTIRKVWREEGVSSRKRRKKHETKQNLREVKRQWRLFQQIDEDTKYLDDIPEYYFQMMRKGLPKMQFTARDVTSGLMYMGFAQERSAINATLFARYLNRELQACGVDISRTARQTDNGSEYINHIHAKKPGPYTLAVEEVPGQIHNTIPPGAHTFQSDVETVHNLVEVEFYEIEHFEDIDDFMNKAFAYQVFFNLFRPNSYKENKTPWQLAKEKQPGLSKRIALIPPVYIEDLMHNNLELSAMGGHDVSSVPFIKDEGLAVYLINHAPCREGSLQRPP
jgi:transposase